MRQSLRARVLLDPRLPTLPVLSLSKRPPCRLQWPLYPCSSCHLLKSFWWQSHCKSKAYFKKLLWCLFWITSFKFSILVSASPDLGPSCPTPALSSSHSTQSTGNPTCNSVHDASSCLIACATDTFLASDPEHTLQSPMKHLESFRWSHWICLGTGICRNFPKWC